MIKVFISYTHDNETHNQKVADLAARLIESGVDVEMDQYTPHPEEGWPTYMMNNVMNSQFTLCICSANYKNRFEQKEQIGIGKGAKFEGKLITQIVYDSEINNKFIPILLDNNYNDIDVPIVLKSSTIYNVSVKDEFISLYARLTNQEQQRKPTLGSVVSIKELQKRIGVNEHTDGYCDKIKKQCIARFRANGLDEEIATKIFNMLVNSNRFNYLLPSKNRTNYVIGDFGSGKSLALSILYLQKIKRQESALFLSAKDIPTSTSLDMFLNIEGIKEKTTIFIDGLDEINYNDGKKLIDGIILAETYSKDLYFVVSSRPSFLITNTCSKQTINIHPLTFDESVEIVQLISKNTAPIGEIYSWSKELQNTMFNPFFAILCGIYFIETNQFVGMSKQAFIKFLIQKSIAPFGMNKELLKQLEFLAAQYVNQEQNKILLSDLNSNIRIEDLLQTGLIQLDEDYVYFGLPIVAQWLAAEFIKNNNVNRTKLIENRSDIIKWRYSIMLLMGNISFEDSREFFRDIVIKFPGIASQILRDNIIREDINALPPSEICGENISFCIHAWAEGLKTLAKVIIPYDGDNICTFKISTYGAWVHIWWMKRYTGRDFEVVIEPPNEEEYFYSSSYRVGKSSIWPWIVTFNSLAQNMKNYIKNPPLFIEFADLKEEFVYDVARKLMRKGSLYRDDISLETLQKAINQSRETMPVYLLQESINKLQKCGIDILKCPQIQPDVPQKSGYVWNMYSREQTIKYVYDIYNKALNIYKDLCDKMFSGLCNVMPRYLMFPVTMCINYSEGNDRSPQIEWHFLCKDYNSTNDVHINIGKKSTYNDDTFKEISNSIATYRPTVSQLCSGFFCLQAIEFYKEKPLHGIVLDWLTDDLKAIGWLN